VRDRERKRQSERQGERERERDRKKKREIEKEREREERERKSECFCPVTTVCLLIDFIFKADSILLAGTCSSQQVRSYISIHKDTE